MRNAVGGPRKTEVRLSRTTRLLRRAGRSIAWRPPAQCNAVLHFVRHLRTSPAFRNGLLNMLGPRPSPTLPRLRTVPAVVVLRIGFRKRGAHIRPQPRAVPASEARGNE